MRCPVLTVLSSRWWQSLAMGCRVILERRNCTTSFCRMVLKGEGGEGREGREGREDRE